MGKAFISYARIDIAFVRRLHEVLEKRGREVWVDWEGIPPTDKWLAKIRSAIDEADAFVFIISPDSLASQVCGMELDHAIKQHKRLIPIMHREVEAGSVRRELSEINYIFARNNDSFDSACETLIASLDMDLQWIRAHTRLLLRATEWERENRDLSYTLRGRDLNSFEEWQAKSPDKEPKPTAIQSEYLLASRRTVTRRQRIIGGAVAVGLSIAVALGTIAYFQNRERARQESIAGARKLVNTAEVLRDGSVDTVGARGRLEKSLQAATQALATLHSLEIPSLTADQAVRKSYTALPKWIDVKWGSDSINASAFDASGAYLVVFRNREKLMIWDTTQRQTAGVCMRPLAAMESTLAVSVANDGKFAVTAIYNATKEVDATEITVWAVPDCSRKLNIQLAGRQDTIALSGGGEHLLVEERPTIRLWNVANQAELALDFSDLVLSSAFSADGQRLASVERDRGERKYWIRIRQLDGKQAVRQWLHPERVQWLQWKRHALVVGGQKTISIYDPDNGKLMHRYPIAQERQFALSGDGKLIAKVVGNYTIVIRDVASDTEVARTSHDAEVANLMFGPHNQSLITVDKVKRRIRVWWFMSDGAFATLRDNAPITMVRFSENEPLLYTQIREGVSTWQLPPPGELSAPHRQETIAESKHFGDYQIAIPVVTNSVEQPTTITIHAADNSLQPRTITIDAQALAAAVSRNGDRLAVTLAAKSTRAGYQRRLEVWNVRTNTRIAMRAFEPVLDAQMAAFLRFAGGDRYLVVGTRVGVAIVDARQLTPVASLYHPDVTLTAVQNDGTLAATVGSSNIVRIWDINSRNEIARIESAQAVRALALSNDDQWLATLDEVGTVRLWALAPNVLIQQACHWLAGPCPH